MAERTDDRERGGRDPEVDDLLSEIEETTLAGDAPNRGAARTPEEGNQGDTGSTGSRWRAALGRVGSTLRSPFSGLFSARSFLLSLVLAVAGSLAVGAAVPFPGTGFLGIALAGFAVGLASRRRRYLELLLAGAIAAGVGSLLNVLVVAFGGLGVPVFALGAGTGAFAAGLGHYLGRDLRAGLTREV